ncbi:Exonuclease [Trypanosoma melophagium]|uniref:Exonuclease n=1 Tax=Trypanosoma melophagium TaxID=715481 RepID=UPI00351A018D|nr:Exonuclease [Trypanosoma melophagium]
MRRAFIPRGRAPKALQNYTHLDIFTQLQLGIHPPLSAQRQFIQQHFEEEMERRGITEAKLLAMDGRLCTRLLRQLLFERYLSVPFRLFTFDLEFTGPPVFGPDGPTEDIMEFGFYSPAHDKVFSCLVRPRSGRRITPEVTALTNITEEMLQRDGLPFPEAWKKVMDVLLTPEPEELPGAEERLLVLSHGGKLADVSLIKWTLEAHGMELPPSLVFGDTLHLIRDAHRRRPVTPDKHPPSWGLVDLVQWMKIPPTLPAHRAGNDAKMTWDALYHTLERYGDEDLTPREQLISRFFDAEAKQVMSQEGEKDRTDPDGTLAADGGIVEASVSSSLDLDFDEIFTPDGRKRGAQNSTEIRDSEDGDDRMSDKEKNDKQRACELERHIHVEEFVI